MNKWMCPLLVLGLLFSQSPADAGDPPGRIRLHSLFGDNMVVQRDAPLPVLGTAPPETRLTVTMAGRVQSTLADRSGQWRVVFAPLKSPGPYTMTVTALGVPPVTVTGILAGDVWLCSGQSNMGWPVRGSRNAPQEIAEAHHPLIRLFAVQDANTPEPMADVQGTWQICSPDSVAGFSAAGYFFGRDLLKELDVPVGLIDAAWGGSAAEQWTPVEGLFDEPRNDFANRSRAYHAALASWRGTYIHTLDPDGHHLDSGNQGFARGWAGTAFDDRDWKTMDLPGFFEDVSPEMKIDGAVWFRKRIRISEGLVGRELLLSLGPIDDFDVTYFNGARIGSTGSEVPRHWSKARQYAVPAHLVTNGEAVVAVRVFDNFAGGGFSGPASNLCVSVKGGATTIPLSGPWKYTVEYALREMPNLCGNWSFGNLFNGMIHPLLDFPVKGVIWYQGESNTERVDDYPVLLGSMIKSWRAGWKQGDLPFYQVQLAGFMPAPRDPEDTDWARLREAQVTTAREVPNCGIVTALDLGDAKDIHPANKQEVGRRLALAALKNTYGKDLVASGPVYDAYSVEEDKVRITFKETGGGLMAKGGSPLKQFTVAGPDRTFVWAQARVAGDSVVVWSAHVPKPVAVRYAWANNPEGANLCNQEGLPAFPFRTDRWPATPAQSSPQP